MATRPSVHAELLAVNEQLPWGGKITLGFIGCRFERCSFENSIVRQILFAECEMIDNTANTCDFTGIRAEPAWWAASAQCNMEHAYLHALIETATAACGPESIVVGKLLAARTDMRAGKEADFSAAMYGEDVPGAELDKLERVTPKLDPRFRPRSMHSDSQGAAGAEILSPPRPSGHAPRPPGQRGRSPGRGACSSPTMAQTSCKLVP